MSDQKKREPKQPREMTTKEAMRKLFPPQVVEEAKKKALAQRKYRRS